MQDSLCRLVQRSPLTPEQAKTLKGLRVPVSARAALWRAFLVSAEPSGAAARAGPAPVLDPPNLIGAPSDCAGGGVGPAVRLCVCVCVRVCVCVGVRGERRA